MNSLLSRFNYSFSLSRCVLDKFRPPVPSIPPESNQPPIENEIDVLEEALDEIVNLRKGSATFKYEMIVDLRCGEKQLERETDPVILLDDDWPNTHPGGSVREEIVTIPRA